MTYRKMPYEQRNYTEDLFFQYLRFPRAPEFQMHLHNAYEILLLIRGDVVYQVEGNEYELSAGDVVITNPHEMHRPIIRGGGEYERLIALIKPKYLSAFITRDYSPFAAMENRKIGCFNRLEHKLVESSGIRDKLDTARFYADNPVPQSEAYIKANLLLVLLTLNDLLVPEEQDVKVSRVDEIIQYINDNLTADISLSQLEETFHMSKYHMSHQFKEKTNYSILEYITHKRVMYAKELLLEGVPPTEVAFRVGFNDYAGFYRAFKKMTGATPKEIHVK